MGVKVKLVDIVGAMEFHSLEGIELLARRTGKLIYVSEKSLRDADNGKLLEDVEIDWMREELELAYDIIEHRDDYLEVPSEYEVNEYRMMERFCLNIENEESQDTLLRAIQGRGAFRRFKDTIADLEITQDWYDYRNECYKEIAIEYCESNGLEFEE